MLRIIIAFLGYVLLAVGLLGFFWPNVFYLVQFDLFQSLIYVTLGAIGLVLSFKTANDKKRLTYLKSLAIINLFLLMLGFSWPNFGDIVHLEVPENFFHGLIGIFSAITADIFRRQHLTQ